MGDVFLTTDLNVRRCHSEVLAINADQVPIGTQSTILHMMRADVIEEAPFEDVLFVTVLAPKCRTGVGPSVHEFASLLSADLTVWKCVQPHQATCTALFLTHVLYFLM